LDFHKLLCLYPKSAVHTDAASLAPSNPPRTVDLPDRPDANQNVLIFAERSNATDEKYAAQKFCTMCPVLSANYAEEDCLEDYLNYFENFCGHAMVKAEGSPGNDSLNCGNNSSELKETVNKITLTLNAEPQIASMDQLCQAVDYRIRCGNGKLDPGEECDLGLGYGQPYTGTVSCSSACTVPDRGKIPDINPKVLPTIK